MSLHCHLGLQQCDYIRIYHLKSDSLCLDSHYQYLHTVEYLMHSKSSHILTFTELTLTLEAITGLFNPTFISVAMA